MFTVRELLSAIKGKLVSGKGNAGVTGISIDSRTISPDEAFIAIKGDNFDGHDFIEAAIKKGAGAVVTESQVSSLKSQVKTPFVIVKDSIKALGDIARFNRRKFDIPVIAVTGSNGKTTTKDMVSWVLSGKSSVLKNAGTKNNHIGLPLTLANLNSSHDFAVLEIGTNHFGEVAYLADICRPNIGVITNIGPSHLENLRDLKGVFKEKAALIRYLSKPFVSILNRDDRFLKEAANPASGRPFAIGFGVKDKADFSASDIKSVNEKTRFLVNKKYKFTLNTIGYYNVYNALAAIAAARLFGMDYEDISSRLSAFSFPPSRLNLVEFKKIRFIDDTYNSNPNSLKLALEALGRLDIKGRKIFIMGDMMELGAAKRLFHRRAGRLAASVCDVLVTVGALSKISADMAAKSGFKCANIFSCASSREAKEILFKQIAPGGADIVLVKGSRSMKMEEVFKVL